MGHKHRIEVSGGLYHVTSRGNARQPIFLENLAFGMQVLIGTYARRFN